jgi:hypothetical protein
LSFEFNYRVLSGRSRIKTFRGSEIVVDRERHLALEMPTSRMAHADREREREHTCKTTTRQNLSN